MEDPNHSSFVMTFINIFLAYIKRLSDIAQLASLEARLAARTLFCLISLFFVLFILVTASWFSILFLICSYTLSLGYSLFFSATILCGLNLLLLAIIAIAIIRIKRNLFFPATRREIQTTAILSKDV